MTLWGVKVVMTKIIADSSIVITKYVNPKPVCWKHVHEQVHVCNSVLYMSQGTNFLGGIFIFIVMKGCCFKKNENFFYILGVRDTFNWFYITFRTPTLALSTISECFSFPSGYNCCVFYICIFPVSLHHHVYSSEFT